MKNIILPFVLLGSFPAFANDGPDFNYFDLSYAKVKISDTSIRPAGWSFQGSFTLSDHFYLVGSYYMLNETFAGGDLDLNNFSAGLGAKYSLSPATSLYAELSFENAEASMGGIEEEIDGYGAAIGVRTVIHSKLQADLKYKYIDSDEDGVESSDSIRVAGYYYFYPEFAVGLSYEFGDETDVGMVTARYAF